MNKQLATFGRNSISRPQAPSNAVMPRQIARSIDRIISLEQGRAVLADAALQNIAALSMAELHLAEITPSARGRLEFIVDTYTASAAAVIRGTAEEDRP